MEATYTVMKTFIAEHIAWLNTEYKNQYDALGCENLAEIPDEVAEGQKGFIFLGQNAYFNSNYGEYAYKFVGTERNMVEGAKLTITGDVTNIDSYVGSIMRWDDKKEITLTADDVSALAANNYTIDIVSWGGTISSVEITWFVIITLTANIQNRTTEPTGRFVPIVGGLIMITSSISSPSIPKAQYQRNYMPRVGSPQMKIQTLLP